MKKFAALITVLIMVFTLASCGGEKKADNKQAENKGCEIALVIEGNEINDGGFNETTWNSIESFSLKNNLECKYYKTKEASADAYLTAIQKATEDGAKLVILSGSQFETTVYTAQNTYPDIKFLLIDGVPHDDASNYVTGANTISIIFAEEEAGYMAGYAAVKDGYTKLGFMGGAENPAVKRYGYGFVQGAAAAAEETETKVDLRYKYAGTFDESKDVQKLAASWYKDGTEVIFACGGGMNLSVMKAAENNGGKVIGSDVDQSSVSDTVITSAKKDIGNAVEQVLESYEKNEFVGAMAFNYAAKNDGVSLEIENAHFNRFTEKDYHKLFKKLANSKIELKKDTGVSSAAELSGSWVTLKQE